MAFTQGFILLAIVPFLLLFFFLRKLERRRALVSPGHEGGVKNRLIGVFTRGLPKALWFGTALCAIVALAGLFTRVPKEGILVQGRIKCISLDLSTSMRATSRSVSGRSSVDVIKEVTMPFVDKRVSTDYITVTVYGGKGFGPDFGDATILVRPTQNAEFIKKQIKAVNPGMVGMYTSIGEGIFTCLSSMLDQEFEKHKVDRFRLRDGLEKGDWQYPGIVAQKINRMRNMIIVLFTDGVNNAGIDPITMTKFVRMLGIKMYFSVLESTGATGVSPAEEEKRRGELKDAVRATGGFDFSAKKAEDVEKHYNAIDRFEAAGVRIIPGTQEVSHSREWLFASIVLFAGMALVEIVFLKIP